VLGYAFLLRDAGLGGEPAAQVERIEGAATQLLELIEDLLDLNSLQLGRLAPQIETCDAVALLKAAMAALAPPPRLEVRVLAPDASVPVRTDGSQVVRILRHLLSNAYKFTPQGSVTLRVRMASASPWSEEARRGGDLPHAVLWEVEDTGIGIGEDDLARVFDEFRQVDGSSTRRYGGAGLGLALSRQLAQRLGGDISVRSTPGEGSRFTLSLAAGLTRPELVAE
jgi:signal transduction histidine kinase